MYKNAHNCTWLYKYAVLFLPIYEYTIFAFQVFVGLVAQKKELNATYIAIPEAQVVLTKEEKFNFTITIKHETEISQLCMT